MLPLPNSQLERDEEAPPRQLQPEALEEEEEQKGEEKGDGQMRDNEKEEEENKEWGMWDNVKYVGESVLYVADFLG